MNKDIRQKITKYFLEQGYDFKDKEVFIKLITRQRVYGLVTKIIFYLTIRRFFKNLPDILESYEQDLNELLKNAFQDAQQIDWQAVFEDDLIDDLGIPQTSYLILREFFSELRAYFFEQLPDDVIGELFEKIIDPEQRHDLGQYFTNEYLVDLILGSVVNDKEGFYLDPTCGSGTFLIRLYDRIRYINSNQLKHNDVLNRIWGFDIGKFPSELSTINLFRQDPKEYENFPRVLKEDIFDVHKGAKFKFPPPKAGKSFSKIEKELPEFKAIVGNFPFIRQEKIEKESKGYKQKLTKLLAKEYLLSYPELFEIKNKIKNAFLVQLKKEIPAKQLKQINNWVDKGDIQLKLSGQADIYAYIYIHTATLLSENGSFAIITSNSWLDVSYGSVLKQFFLDHFKIKTIIASWAEPWFEDAAVNTVVTILEKEKDAGKRKNNNVKFVKLKKKLEELIPFNDLILDRSKRWNKIQDVVDIIDTSEFQKNVAEITENISSFENDDMRIRIVKQALLEDEQKEDKEGTKWMKYLRAPDVYFEILEKCKDKFDDLNQCSELLRGYTTGVNEFFFLELDDNSTKSVYKNERNWIGKIEQKFIEKIITSPKDFNKIILKSDTINSFIFKCNLTKEELKKKGYLNCLEYIEWGEKQKTNKNISWNKVETVKNRKNWYELPERENPKILWTEMYFDTFRTYIVDGITLESDKFYRIQPNKNVDTFLLGTYLNSTLINLLREINSFTSLGDGVIKSAVYEVEKLPVPKDLRKIKFSETNKIFKRRILPIFEEIKQKDRQELDRAVLKALGLNPDEYLQKIYDGLCEMVRERLELPKMRKRKKKQVQKSSFEFVKKSVIEECLENGAKKFPEDFYNYAIKIKNAPSNYSDLKFEEYSTNGSILKVKSFFTQYHLLDEKNKNMLEVDSESKAEFAIILSHQKDRYVLKIPEDEKIADKMVSAYKGYVVNLKSSLLNNANQKLHDWVIAEKMVGEILNENELFEFN